ncbi:MAG TPA: DUF192 domain-containing protein [Anaerolineales bacterium]|nr:DUF192 domain-containing protein [Anaerolineales bacterium]
MPDLSEPAFSSGHQGACAIGNRTRGAPLAGQVRVCRSFGSRLRGLMMRRRMGSEQGVLLVMSTTSRIDSAIHMLFVFFPIAVFWLDEEGLVVSRCLAKPWRLFYAPQRPARYVLEVAQARIDSAAVGDRLALDAAGAAR